MAEFSDYAETLIRRDKELRRTNPEAWLKRHTEANEEQQRCCLRAVNRHRKQRERLTSLATQARDRGYDLLDHQDDDTLRGLVESLSEACMAVYCESHNRPYTESPSPITPPPPDSSDFVVMASGGPLMTVECVEGDKALVTWSDWDDGQEVKHQSLLPVACLSRLVPMA